MLDWSSIFNESLPYEAFLDRYGSDSDRAKWAATHAGVTITDSDRELIESFVRRMPILCMAGAWCGDCVHQCPILETIARLNPQALELRFIDRDAREDVADALSVNGGRRVPAVLFLNEDFQEVARFGDRTLARYRILAAEQLGPSCPTGLPPDGSEFAAVTAEWVNQFERAQLILRLSPKFREKYGD